MLESGSEERLLAPFRWRWRVISIGGGFEGAAQGGRLCRSALIPASAEPHWASHQGAKVTEPVILLFKTNRWTCDVADCLPEAGARPD